MRNLPTTSTAHFTASGALTALGLARELAGTARTALDAAGPAGESAWALYWLSETDAATETDADPTALSLLAAVASDVAPAALAPAAASEAVLRIEDAAHGVAAEAVRLASGVPEADRRALAAGAVALAEGDLAPAVRLAALLLIP